MDLLTIGAFARLAHLSPKALRIYDELHLLPPVQLDPDTGYRWYSPDQLEQARLHEQRRDAKWPNHSRTRNNDGNCRFRNQVTR